MAKQSDNKLNRLQRLLPEGLIVDAAWMGAHGYSTSLRRQYVQAGWLEQPVRRVYRRPGPKLTWQQVVFSMQSLLGHELFVGGRTALELQGYAHYLNDRTHDVNLYGITAPPTWLMQLNVGVRFLSHNSLRLFDGSGLKSRDGSLHAWGQWEWKLLLSSPERAVLEMLDELPDRESFERVDKLMEGMVNLNPRRIEKYLVECHNIKVKRLFFFFADRHGHGWLQKLDKSKVDLGSGKRMLVRGGKLNSEYLITLPEELYGI